MKKAIWSRIGPVTGLLFLALLLGGAFIHGYPDIRPTDKQLASWLASVDPNRFKIAVYIEALGTVLFIPFAVWLYRHLRQGAPGSSQPALVMLAGSVLWVSLTLPINQGWVGLLEQARRGLDIHVAQTVVSINQTWFDMTGIVLGLILAAAGVSILRGGVMSRWAGGVAIVIGLAQAASTPFGTDSTPAGLLAYVWLLGVAGYYTFRPARPRELARGSAQPPVASGLPATR